jgi:hypothetical protein
MSDITKALAGYWPTSREFVITTNDPSIYDHVYNKNAPYEMFGRKWFATSGQIVRDGYWISFTEVIEQAPVTRREKNESI